MEDAVFALFQYACANELMAVGDLLILASNLL
jgi:hypothetical protein